MPNLSEFWQDIIKMVIKTIIVSLLLVLSNLLGTEITHLITAVFGALVFYRAF